MVGERRALASAIMAFYFLLFVVFAMSGLAPGAEKMFYALAGVYGLAFFSLVAGYFWARWYSVGLGLFGVIAAVVTLFQARKIEDPYVREIIIKQMLFFGGTHLGASLMLWGDAMSQGYDGKTAWREKFHMDDNAVQRLGRAVIRAGVSLPFVLLYAFTPREPASMLASIVALALTGLGIRALVKLKTWGVLALGMAGFLMMTITAVNAAGATGTGAVLVPGIAGVFLLAAAAPFSRQIARFVAVR